MPLPNNRDELKTMLEQMRSQGATNDELASAVREVKLLRPDVNYSESSIPVSDGISGFNQQQQEFINKQLSSKGMTVDDIPEPQREQTLANLAAEAETAPGKFTTTIPEDPFTPDEPESM